MAGMETTSEIRNRSMTCYNTEDAYFGSGNETVVPSTWTGPRCGLTRSHLWNLTIKDYDDPDGIHVTWLSVGLPNRTVDCVPAISHGTICITPDLGALHINFRDERTATYAQENPQALLRYPRRLTAALGRSLECITVRGTLQDQALATFYTVFPTIIRDHPEPGREKTKLFILEVSNKAKWVDPSIYRRMIHATLKTGETTNKAPVVIVLTDDSVFEHPPKHALQLSSVDGQSNLELNTTAQYRLMADNLGKAAVYANDCDHPVIIVLPKLNTTQTKSQAESRERTESMNAVATELMRCIKGYIDAHGQEEWEDWGGSEVRPSPAQPPSSVEVISEAEARERVLMPDQWNKHREADQRFG